MNTRKLLVALGLGLASTLAFAAQPNSGAAPAPAAKSAPAKKHLASKHATCKADETLVKGKCEAKKTG